MPNSQHLDTSVDSTPQEARAINLTTKSQLNKIIVNKDGTPDYLAINLYWDTFRSWYTPHKRLNKDGSIYKIRKLKTKGVYIDYNKLIDLHGVSRETIRKKIVKLEQLGLLNRSFQHKNTVTTKSFNQIIIYVWKQTPYFFSEYGIDIENTELNPYTSHNHIADKHAVVFSSKPIQYSPNKVGGGVQPRLDTKKLIEPFSKEKDRSNESNFEKNNLSTVSDKIENLETKKTKKSPSRHHNTKNSEVRAKNVDIKPSKPVCPKSSGKKLLRYLKPRKLSDFYPLSDSDVSTLQSSSGRNFTSRAMNEILQDMSRKLAKPRFWSKKGFMAYMTEAIKYEKRDAVKTANIDFRISANQTQEESKAKLEEQYLTELEYSLQVGPEWHLKKKLASTLERSKAYSLLTSIKMVELQADGVLRINLTKAVELSQMDKVIILNQAKATHERFESGEFVCVERVELIPPEEQRSRAEPNRARDWQGNAEHDEVEDADIWSQIKRRFARYFGEDGEAIEKHWLSKLTAKISEESKSLELTASSDMVRDIVESRYMTQLSRSARESGYYLAGFG